MAYNLSMAQFVVAMNTANFRRDNSSDAIRMAIKDIYFDEPEEVVDRIGLDVRALLDNQSPAGLCVENFVELEGELRQMLESGIVGPPTQEDLNWLTTMPANEEFGALMTPTVKRLLTAGLLKVDWDKEGIETYKVA